MSPEVTENVPAVNEDATGDVMSSYNIPQVLQESSMAEPVPVVDRGVWTECPGRSPN